MLVTPHICPWWPRGKKPHAYCAAPQGQAEGKNSFGGVYHPAKSRPIKAEGSSVLTLKEQILPVHIIIFQVKQ